MSTRYILLFLVLISLCACSTANRITADDHQQATKTLPEGGRTAQVEGKSAVRKFAGFPFKAVGTFAAGLGLIIIELAAHHDKSESQYSSRTSQGELDVGLMLSGVGLAAGGALMYEFGKSISD